MFVFTYSKLKNIITTYAPSSLHSSVDMNPKIRVLHIDGDAFFASCEQSVNKNLRNKPLVIGGNKGIGTAISYEAKALGIVRGDPIYKIRQNFPNVIIKEENFSLYKHINQQLIHICQRYSDIVEEYSIDECFLDISNTKHIHTLSPLEIANAIHTNIKEEINISTSIGIAPNKVLSKVGSTINKPGGITLINHQNIEQKLLNYPINNLWGVGNQTSKKLDYYKIKTAEEFRRKSIEWIKSNLSIPYQTIWYELQGIYINKVNNGSNKKHKSITKSRTFKPSSNKLSVIKKEIHNNIYRVCKKARKLNLKGDSIIIFIKDNHFQYRKAEIKIEIASNTPNLYLKKASKAINSIFCPYSMYRSTGATLQNPQSSPRQMDLFGLSILEDKRTELYNIIDKHDQKAPYKS